MTTHEIIGQIGVDSGTIWVGDPCYVLGADASHGPKSWHAACEAMEAAGHWAGDHPVSEPFGSSIGLAVGTLYGDGLYPVIAERDAKGRIVRITVDFDPGDE